MPTEVGTPVLRDPTSDPRPTTSGSTSTTCTPSSNVRNTHPRWLGRRHSISDSHASTLDRRLMLIASSMEKNPSQAVLAMPLQSSAGRTMRTLAPAAFSSTSSRHQCSTRVPRVLAVSITSLIRP
jgi:hypothetical protein